jgi:hypothetical protein
MLMQEVDAGDTPPLSAEPDPALSSGIEDRRWPNAAVVLAALAALEEEFKTVLRPPADVAD